MDELILLDRQLLLALNGSESTAWDSFFMTVTHTAPWIPLFVFIVLALLWRRPWREVVLIVVCTALVVLIADRFSSGLCKPLFHRFRPSHEPALDGLVDIVGDYRGGLYGFFSSHAANTFGVATFVALCLWRKTVGRIHKNSKVNSTMQRLFDAISQPRLLVALLYAWAALSSYSRIYLGLHYPGDILVGILCGIVVAWLVYRCVFLPVGRRLTS